MALRDLAAGLGDFAQERSIERDVEAELAAHLDLASEALEGAGHAPEQARKLAQERFGDFDRIRRECLRVRQGGIHAMKKLLVVSNLVLVALLLISLLVARTQHVRAKEALQVAMMEVERARSLAREAVTPVDHIVVEVGDVIETLDQHRNVDFGEQAAVQADGKVLLHDVGWVEIAGLTREEVEQRLTEAYAPYYQDLTVNVIVHKRAK
jgi:PAS domain-containing protein